MTILSILRYFELSPISAESRISDVNVAEEMIKFIRNQILAKTATAMLPQANQRQYIIMDLLK